MNYFIGNTSTCIDVSDCLVQVLQSTRQENVQLSQQLTRSQEDYDKAKEEAQEVLQSLEEVALNYDMKCQEADDQEKEKMALAQQLAGLQVCLNTVLWESSIFLGDLGGGVYI